MENTIQNFRYEFGAKLHNGFQRKHYIICDDSFELEKQKWILDHHETDVYQCSYGYETNDIDNCNIISDLYFDFDGDISTEESFQQLAFYTRRAYRNLEEYFSIKKNDVKLFFSGAKGFHIIIPAIVLNIKEDKNLNIHFKKIAMWLKETTDIPGQESFIDTGIYDRKRLLRIPNTINSKTGLYKVPITLDMLYDFTLNKMLDYASNKKEIKYNNFIVNEKAEKKFNELKVEKVLIKINNGFSIPLEPQEMLPCANKLLVNGAQEGGRNNACVILSSSLLQSGKSKDDAYEILKEWNQLNEPPLNENELYVTFNSAYYMLKNNRRYGCTGYKNLDYCIGKECKLYGE